MARKKSAGTEKAATEVEETGTELEDEDFEQDFEPDDDEEDFGPVSIPRPVSRLALSPSYGGGLGIGPAEGPTTPPPQVPAFPGASRYPSSCRLKITRVEGDGAVSTLGTKHKDITAEQIISLWPKPGVYFLYMIDAQGQELQIRENPTRLDVPEDHLYLQQLQRSAAGQRPNGGGGGTDELVRLLLAQAEAREQAIRDEMARMREELKAEREMLAKKEAEVQQAASALAVANLDHVLESSSKLMETDRQRQERVTAELLANQERERERTQMAARMQLEQQQSFFQAALEQQKQASQMFMEHMKTIQAETAARAEREALREKEAREREERRLEAWQKAEEARLERLRKEEKAAALREDSRQKEHTETILGLLQRDKADDFMAQLAKFKEVSSELGGGEKGVVGQVADVFMELQKSKTQMEIERLKARAAAGGDFDDDDFDEEELEMLQQLQAAQAAQAAGLLPPPGIDPSMGQQQPQAQPMTAEAQAEAQRHAQGAPRSSNPDKVKQLPVQLVKAGRLAARATVSRLRSEPNQTQWPQIVMGAIMAEPALVEYLRATSIYSAAVEAGADYNMASDIALACETIAGQHDIPAR